MRTLIALWRLGRLLLHVLHGLLIVWLRWPALNAAGRQARVRWWSGQLLRVLGVRLEVVGQGRPGAKLLVANHVSWLDIAAMHAVLPEARFVSKASVKDWPLVGTLVSAVGTLYIERASKRDALRVVHQMAAALTEGDTVAVFPEGTTGPGWPLLPMHGNLLQAAISTEVPLQPVVLRWHQPGRDYSEAAQFIGQMTLLESMWRILSARELAVRVQVLAAQGTAHADRRALVEHVAELIAAELPQQG
ncbi:1-acyl-sn-glycerol-3-phosphate acyltransferase [Pelomonas sp. CA6]|uniref:lysophospholipid acyltransferase family protein n=1 Tax=Pelomonas sp. CA6 TaxID=2907999 RepID=UPI001F4BF88C|nr:lysophospholipid acyltransferase family protein [Pelomonas sp. CA6]MCH7344354.1 1-acyl-sn-glycerol-3-phosphate acyltransferase [Pelomonas sp. CA6]